MRVTGRSPSILFGTCLDLHHFVTNTPAPRPAVLKQFLRDRLTLLETGSAVYPAVRTLKSKSQICDAKSINFRPVKLSPLQDG